LGLSPRLTLTYEGAATDLRPGEFVHTLGDAHVYSNHVEPLQQQLLQSPRPFPTLRINTELKDIDQIRFEHLEIVGYAPHKKIDMQMAV
jgi:thymidylate synthase